MKPLQHYQLNQYLDVLASRKPVPGGGSAAALVAANGAALIEMVANYSLGRAKTKRVEQRLTRILAQSAAYRSEFLACVDHDAEAYALVVSSRKGTAREKRHALAEARRVPKTVARRCYQAMDLIPYLVINGNPHLLSDLEVAAEFLIAAFNAAMINVAVNAE